MICTTADNGKKACRTVKAKLSPKITSISKDISHREWPKALNAFLFSPLTPTILDPLREIRDLERVSLLTEIMNTMAIGRTTSPMVQGNKSFPTEIPTVGIFWQESNREKVLILGKRVLLNTTKVPSRTMKCQEEAL